MADLIDTMVMPTEIGNFVGDIYFGISSLPTLRTHTWTGKSWCPMMTEEEIMRAEITALRADNERLRAVVERIYQCSAEPRVIAIAREGLDPLTAQPAAPGVE